MIPYGRQSVDDHDVKAVIEALRSDRLTTGDRVQQFEDAVARRVGAENAVAVSSGSAALHAAMSALNIGPGDAVVVPSITFVATAHAVTACGGVPLFCDVHSDTLSIDVGSAGRSIDYGHSKGLCVKAIIAVDYAGLPCDYRDLRDLASRRMVALVADAAHSLGAHYNALRVGVLADMTCFSFHPLKLITTGEGGMVVTGNQVYRDEVRQFRNLGRDHTSEVTQFGCNYRLSDIHCALGLSQLGKMSQHLERRREIAARYDAAFQGVDEIQLLSMPTDRSHARHLYVIRSKNRVSLKVYLLGKGIRTQVHYVPLHQWTYYRRLYATHGLKAVCPTADKAEREILSLPIFPGLSDEAQAYIINTVKEGCS